MEYEDLKKIAIAYQKLLVAIDWDDEILVAGMQEGLNKFLSNALIFMNKKNKYKQADYYSKEAIEKLKKNDMRGLVFEHMVPKTRYIQGPCIEEAKQNRLTIDFIVNLLNKYWKIAVITIDQDKMLLRTKMPNNWDQEDIFARYRAVGIELVPNASI